MKCVYASISQSLRIAATATTFAPIYAIHTL